MKRVIEYTVIMNPIPLDFINVVNQMIADGWQPQGGVFITQGPPIKQGEYLVAETRSHQAMVKFED